MYEIIAVEWVGWYTSRLGGVDRGGSIQGGRPMGLNFYSSVRSAYHHQNHFAGKGRSKSSSPSRRLLSLSVDVALHTPWVAIPSFTISSAQAQPLTRLVGAWFLSFSSRSRPCIR